MKLWEKMAKNLKCKMKELESTKKLIADLIN
jgi:hypothetical protein